MNVPFFSSPRRLPSLALLVCMFATAPVFAQEPAGICTRALDMAKTEFDAGLFDRSSERISVCLQRGEFTADEERQAYLLLGMIYYANLQIEQARNSLRNLLQRDPAIELDSTQYKPGFVNLLSEVRSEIVQQEVPAPIPPAVAAPAPKRPHRSGFWGSVGIGPGGSELSCRACDLLPSDDPWRGGSGPSIAITLGGTLSDQLLIGGEFNYWSRSVEDNPRVASISSLAAVIRYYPSAGTDFFLKAGLGVGGLALEGESVQINSGGVSIQLGLGYDIRLGIGKRFALTPFVNLVAVRADGGQTRVAGATVIGPANPGFVQLGLAGSWF